MPGRPASRVAHSNCECIAHGRQCCELGVERCLAIQRLVLHTAVSQNATRGNNVAIAATRCRKSCRGEPSQDQLSPAMAQPPQAKLLSYEIHYTAFLLSVAVGFLAFMSHIRSHSAQSPAAATCIVSSVQCPVSRVRRWLVVWQCKMACRPGRTTSKLMQRTMLQKLLFAWLQQQHLLAAFRERRLLRPLGEPWRESEPQDRRPNLPGQARHRQAGGQGCRCQSRGQVNPNRDFSQSQKRKQGLSGWKVAKAILDSLRENMNLPGGTVAAVHVMYGYDSSVVEQALRSASSVPSQMVCQVVWADLDADVHVTQPNTRLTKWLKASNKRAMKQLLMNDPKNEAELKMS